MTQSARLLEQVSAEIEARAATAARLAAEVAEAEHLAQLNEAERNAVARLVRSEMSTVSHRSSRESLVIGFLFFIGGVAATAAVTLFVRPLR